MKPYHWTILWLLPILGLGLGYGYAYISYHGLLVSWRQVGKPDENIVRINGIRDGRRLLVTTESGKNYALDFFDQEPVPLPLPVSWQSELEDTVDPHTSIQHYGADFYPWPPPVMVEQLYEHNYIYRVEGKGELKFALAPNGNLWMWHHHITGLTGLIYYFYPIYGFFAGIALALVSCVITKFFKLPSLKRSIDFDNSSL